MTTIRERDAEFSGIPDMPPLTGPDSAQSRAYDRRALLTAGDALAEAAEGAVMQLVNLGAIVRTDPRYRGTPMATETMLRAALAEWETVAG